LRGKEASVRVASDLMPRGRSEEGVALGRRLAALRDAADLTQQAAAYALGVGERTYQAWEAGQRIPRHHNRVKLAELYGGAAADYLPHAGGDGRLAALEARLAAIEEALALYPEAATVAEVVARLTEAGGSPPPPAHDPPPKRRRARRPRSA
jgi:transcriptional regulator with XRE-family HTH domain